MFDKKHPTTSEMIVWRPNTISSEELLYFPNIIKIPRRHINSTERNNIRAKKQ